MNSANGPQKFAPNQWGIAFAASCAMFGIYMDNGWSSAIKYSAKYEYVEDPTFFAIGAIIAAVLANVISTKKTLLSTSIFIIPRIAAMYSTPESPWVITLTSVGWGITSVTVPLYISEIAGAHNRGNLMAMQLPVCLLGPLATWVLHLSSEHCDVIRAWRIALVFNSMLLHVIMVSVFPETPYYLHCNESCEGTVQPLASTVFEGDKVTRISNPFKKLTKSNLNDVRQRWVERIKKNCHLRNLLIAVIIFVMTVLRQIGEENYQDRFFSKHESRFETEFKIPSIELGISVAELIASVIIILQIRSLARRSFLLFVIMFRLTVLIISTLLLESSFISYIFLTVAVQRIGNLIFIAVTFFYLVDSFSIDIQAIVIAAVMIFEVFMRYGLSMFCKLYPKLYDNQEVDRRTMIYFRCSMLFVLFLCVLFIHDTRSETEAPNDEIVIEDEGNDNPIPTDNRNISLA